MSQQIGVFFIHGMGATKADYFAKLRTKLRASSIGHRLVFSAVNYQTDLQPNQQRYYEASKAPLRWRKLRKFMLYGFSDASSLESQKYGADSPYMQAQIRVMEAQRALFAAMNGPERPYIVIAHSLGGQVMSNYLWDATRETPPANGIWSKPPTLDKAEMDFCKGANLQRLYTTGCNIPLFVAGRDEAEIKPIPRLHPGFKWLNYYDKDDALAWPLGPLCKPYANLVEDRGLNAGLATNLWTFIASFTPLSHTAYWSDGRFVKDVVADLSTF